MHLDKPRRTWYDVTVPEGKAVGPMTRELSEAQRMEQELLTVRRKALWRPFMQAVRRYALIRSGDRIAVCISGGKDSMLLALLMRILQRHSEVPFEAVYLIMDPGYSPENRRRVSKELRAALRDSRVIGLGSLQASGKLADPSAVIPFEALLDAADYVVVEADGAASRPLKAHRPWEPVVPACSTATVGVAGASGIGQPASLACHCPERFCALAGLGVDEPVRPEHVAAVLNREALADCWLVNQADVLPDIRVARRLCDLIEGDAFPCSLGR